MLYAFRSEIKGCTFDISLFSRGTLRCLIRDNAPLYENKHTVLEAGQEAERPPQTFRSVKGINQGIIICHVSSFSPLNFSASSISFRPHRAVIYGWFRPLHALFEMLAKMKLEKIEIGFGFTKLR